MTDDDIDFMRNWLSDAHASAKASGDTRREKLGELFEKCVDAITSRNGLRQLQISDQGYQLARELAEPWYELLFIHGKITARRELHQLVGAIDEAVAATVLLQKQPGYRLMACTYNDLAAVQQAVDPLGSSAQTKPLLEYIGDLVAPHERCAGCLRSRWISYFLDSGQLEDAKQKVLESLDELDESDGPSTRDRAALDLFHTLAAIAFRQGNIDDMAKWSAAANERLSNAEPTTLAEANLWQALVHVFRGDCDEARRLEQRAAACAVRSKDQLSDRYYDAHVAYHEGVGNLGQAIALRQSQLKSLQGCGMTGRECLCLIEICRLKLRLGQQVAREAAHARGLAAQLPNSQAYFDRLVECGISPNV
jgi:hypothetical protein